MNQRQADIGAGVLVTGILAVGSALSWDAYQQQQSVDRMGSMMDGSMDAVHGTDPLVYVLGTLFAAAVVGVLYLAVRTNVLPESDGTERSGSTTHQFEGESATPSDPTPKPNGGIEPDPTPTRQVLDVLPEDERRVLEPVLTSPGLTQIELRDRSDFSKSKVSQTVSSLEKRGLLYRERQGRTYRVYPSEELEADEGLSNSQ